MKKLNVFLLTILTIFLSISCEIGLGSAVDTEPPSIEISNPPVDTIVRGDFAVCGTWSDDGSIASVTVTLSRTDGKGTPVKCQAVVAGGEGGKGTWRAPINPAEAGILDGSYEALVEITDGAGHKTTQPRTFAVDNTPPLIVLQRPGTKITETPDAYGQTFTLNGMGADDNSIDHIDINIYSDADCTNLLKTITKSNVPPTIQLDVAVFEEGIENDYATIYGSATKNGAQVRYCTITAYDNAKRYSGDGEQTDADKKGNSTTNYYLYDDIYDTVLDHYTITDVYKMLSGTYLLADTNRSADTVTNVKSLLNQYKIEKSNFSLDPENSPQFFVNGRDPLTGSAADFEGSDYNITSGSSVVIEVATGLDGIPLEPSSIRPYLLPCIAGGFTLADGIDIPENRIYLAEAGSGTKSGTSYKYTVNFDHTTVYPGEKFITLGSAYIIRVEGHDKNGNIVRPKGGEYGFKLASNGSAPGLTVTSPANALARVKANGSQIFSGIVTCQDGFPTISIKNGDTTIWSKTFVSSDLVVVNGVNQFNFTYNLSYEGVTENNQIQYTLEASIGDLKTLVYKTVIYDKDAPDIDIGSILPVAQKYNVATESTLPEAGEYLNGVVTLKLTVTDGYDVVDTTTEGKIPYFEVIEVADDAAQTESVKNLWLNKVGLTNVDIVSEPNFTDKHYIKKLINANIDIDTTDIQTATDTGDKKIKFKVHAWDMAGNEKVYTYPVPTESNPNPCLIVSQETDKPVIIPAGDLTFTRFAYTLSDDSDNPNPVNQDENRKTQVSSGGNIQFFIYDDDKIDTYKVWWVPIASNSETKEQAASRIESAAEDTTNNRTPTYRQETGLSSTELTKSVNAESQAGFYWYKLYAKDKNGNETTVGPFMIRVTTPAPVITRVTAVESDSDVAVGKYISTVGGEKTKWKNKIEINSSENSFTLFRYKAPSNPDEAAPSNLNNYEPVPAYNETSGEGYIVDPDNEKILYDTIKKDSTITSSAGDITYYYYVKDGNQNPSNTIECNCLTDSDVPALTIIKPEAGKTLENSISSSPYQFKGTAQENKAISGIYYKVVAANSDGTYTAPAANLVSEAVWTAAGWNSVSTGLSWEFYRNIGSGENCIAEGKHKLYMYVVDAAGNVSDVNLSSDGKQPYELEFHVDTGAPTVSFTPTSTDGNTNPVANTYRNNGFTLKVSAADTYGLKQVDIKGKVTWTSDTAPANWNAACTSYYTDEDCKEAVAADTAYAAGTYYLKQTVFTEGETRITSGTYSKVFKARNDSSAVTDAIPLADGTYTFWTSVTDLANKTVTSEERKFTVDTVEPVFTSNSLKVKDRDWNSSKYYKDTTLKMSGNYIDSTSGVDTLYYYVQYPGRQDDGIQGDVPEDLTALNEAGNNVADDTVSLSQDQTDNTKYNFNFTVDDYQNNTSSAANTLYIQVVDKAGNKSERKDFTINVDTSAPELVTKFYQVGSGTLKNASGTIYVNGTTAITVYGNYKDVESGIKALTNFKIGNTDVTPVPAVTYSTREIESNYDITGRAADEAQGIAAVTPISFDIEENGINATNDKSIRSWKAVFTPSSSASGYFNFEGHNGTYDAEISATGGVTTASPFTITVDTEPPSLQNVRLLIDANTEAYKKTVSGSERYYINNENDTYKHLIISGVASDNVGVDKIELSIDGITTPGNTGNTSVWKFEGIDLSSLSGNSAIATVTVTDVAGNTNSGTPTTLDIYFDKTGPYGTHQLDSLSKDLYFRMGDEDNDDITSETASSYNLDWDTATIEGTEETGVDTKVGKKYSAETYGNGSTIKIRGNIDDADSGVKMIYYAVFDRPIAINENYTTDKQEVEVNSVPSYGFASNDKLRDYVIDQPTGYFAPLSTPQKKRVFYNVSGSETLDGSPLTGTSKYYKYIETTYYETLSGFSKPNNYLVLAAVDNTGNKGLDTAWLSDGSKRFCQINVDNTPPSIALADTEEPTRYSNAEGSLTFSGTVTDDLAGVKSLTFKVNNHEITSTANTYGVMSLDTTSTGLSKTNATWTLTVNSDALKNDSGTPLTGNVFIYGTAIDYAGTGNEQTVSVATIMMDTDAPTVILTDPADADTTLSGRQINGVISLSGTASDNKELYEEVSDTAATMKLYYTTNTDLGTATTKPAATDFETETVTATSAASKWVEIASTSHGNTWTFNDINTAKLDGTNTITDNTPVYFMISAKDKAGNTGYSYQLNASKQKVARDPCIVDQDSDRPVIRFTNLRLNTGVAATTENPNAPYMSATNSLPFTTDTLYGSVSDDDGVSALYYQFADSDSDLTDSGWQTITLSGNAFTLSFGEDGPKKLYFKVSDTGKTVKTVSGTPTIVNSSDFTSSASTTYSVSTPKLIDSASTPNKYGYRGGEENVTSTVTYLKVDTTAPWIGSLQFTTVTTGTPAATDWLAKSEINTMPFGGPNDRKTFRIRIPAWDANGVQTVTMTLPGYGTDNTITFTNSEENAGNTTYPAATWWISEDDIDVSTLTTGNKNCSIIVSDGIKTSEDSFIIAIDNTSPEISVNNPSSTQYSSGSVIAYGETDLTHWKNTSSTDTPSEFMYFALSLDDTTTPAVDYEHQSEATAITSWKDENNGDGSTTISYKPYYTEIKGGSFNWYVYFDGGASTDTETHAEAFKQFLLDTGITTQALLDHPEPTQKFRTKVKAYLWIKAVDQVGNTKVIKHSILIDPQGDAPSVTIEYPETAGTSLGGPVTLRGSATDTKGNNPGVDSVWIQLISAINNGYNSASVTTVGNNPTTCGGLGFTDTVTATTENGTTTYSHAYTLTSFAPKMKDVKQWITAEKAGTKIYHVYTNISSATPTEVTEVGTGDAWADTADGSAYYIKANFSAGGSAWSLKINADKEFDPDTGELNPIAYRVFAKDNDRNLSNYEQQLSVYDSDSPIISELYLRQYSNNEAGTGDVTASRAYEDDMWIKGVWWLCGKASDPQCLSSLTVGSITYTPAAGETNIGLEKEFKVKLNSGEGVGVLSIEIEASDTTEPPHTTTKTCSINYDNTPPELITSGTNYNISSSVRNTNGFYNFGSQVTENPVSGKSQSGFAYLAFWFERQPSGTNTKHVVYDVMRPKKKTVSGEIINASEVNYTGLTEDRGLVWMNVSGITRNENALGTLTLSEANQNIHAGGLCKMGGSIYLIKSRSADGLTITIDGQPEASYTSADFAIANVVNNTIENGSGTKSTVDGSYGYFATVANDDGDHMVESVSKNGTTWTWDANINSQNMADGSIILHYVAFDKAGNYVPESVTGNVANNAPRLASLEVWSDFNENNNKDNGEFKSQYFMGMNRIINGATVQRATSLTSELVVSGNDKDFDDSETPGTSFMTVKATTHFIPELVGGNGDLYYGYRYKKNSESDWTTLTYGASSFGTGFDDGIDEEKDSSGYYRLDDQHENAYILGHKSDNVYLEIPGTIENETADSYTLNALNNSTSTEDPTWFEYTIYDSTEGCAAWGASPSSDSTTGRLYAKFRVALNLQYRDTNPPSAQIRPFYWNSRSENSVCWNSAGKAEGHIELEGDLPSAFSSSTESGIYDRNPKVSGKIKIEGFVEDDIKLKEIWVQFAGHTSLGAENGIKLADYTPTTETKWTTVTHADDIGWDFSAQDLNCDATGHKAKWTLIVDTAKRENAANEDQALVVWAVDDRGSAASVHNGTTQTTSTAMTYYYKMDVVPYITEIETAISKSLKSSIKNAYSRTALGHYIARSTETLVVKGFNLGNGLTAPKYGNTNLTINNDGSVNLPVSLISTSGQIVLTVNNIQTLNNLNDNNACGSSTTSITETSSYDAKNNYAYNRMANGNSNNLLTDDVVVDIWQFDEDAAKPRSGELREPTMQINPVTGKVGVAFVSGPGDFAMAGGFNNAADANANADPTKDIYSYNLWQNNYATFNNVSFTYDSLGYAHATATGLDTNPDSNNLHAGRFSYFYNRWGRSGTDTKGNYNGSNAVRLESLAIPILYNDSNKTKVPWMKLISNGEPSYIRYLNGDTFTEWLDYLLLKGAVPETDSLTETRFYSPSLAATVHETEDSATTSVYLAYFDSLQGQIRFRYTHEIPNSWDSALTYENLIVDKTENTWSVDSNSTFNEEYLTGSEPKIDKGVLTDGGFSNLHHGNNDTDDFVDNLGYFRKSGDWEAYMEANTDHFSLIAGVDYQVNADRNKDKAEMQTEYISSRNVNVDKVDAEGNAYDESFVRYRKGKIDTTNNKIVTDTNTYYKFRNVDGKKYLYKDNKDKLYEVSGEGENIVLKNAIQNNANYGKEIYKVCMNDTYADNTRNYGYPIYERVLDESGNPVDSGAAVYLIPTVETQSVPIIRQKRYPTGYDTGYTAYKYVAIDAKTGTDAAHDVVIAVWYDGKDCRYAYNTNPTSKLDNNRTNEGSSGWKGNKVIFSEGGEYCTVKFDSKGGVHIAAYVDGSLRYAYLSSYNANYKEETDSVRVDSYTITGERINLDVGLEKVGDTEEYVVVPYITYFNGTARKPTVAKLIIPENGVMNYKAQGTDADDVFTGNWEISIVPSPSTLTTNYYDKMNIGLWKWEGIVVNSNDDRFGTAVSSKTSSNNTSSGTNGNIYGNGTANPILGYAVESVTGTYLETAQMK